MLSRFDEWVCKRYRVLRLFTFLFPTVAVPLYFGATWPSAVSVVAGVLLFVWFMRRYQPRHYEPAWRRVAQQLDLEFVPRMETEGAFLRGWVDGRFLTLTAHHPLPKWSQSSFTRITVELVQTRYQFELSTASRHEQSARATLQRERGVGNPLIDPLFIFQNSTPAPIAPLFDDTMAHQLARIGNSPTQQRIRVDTQRLTYRASGILLNPNSLVFLLKLMAALAQRVENAAATPDA